MQPTCVIIVLAMRDCPACSEYGPRFQRVASRYTRQVPTAMLDINSEVGTALAQRFDVYATPTTLLLRRPIGAIRAEGVISDSSLEQLFQLAAAQPAAP